MNAIIVGLGNIAWKFESNVYDGSLIIRNHYDALSKSGFSSIVGVDPDDSTRMAYTTKTGQKAFSSLAEALASLSDVALVSIASPSEFHFQDCKQCLLANIPYIWLEKPAALNVKDIDQLIELKKKSASKIVVNYLRRFSGPYLALLDLVKSESLGSLVSITAHYSRDIFNNGVHMIDLFNFYTGSSEFEILFTDKNAKNPTLFAQSGSIKLALIGHDVDYHNIDITLTFKHGRASVLHGGKLSVVEKEVQNSEFNAFTRLEVTHREEHAFTGHDFLPALSTLLNSKSLAKTSSDLAESLYIARFLDASGLTK